MSKRFMISSPPPQPGSMSSITSGIYKGPNSTLPHKVTFYDKLNRKHFAHFSTYEWALVFCDAVAGVMANFEDGDND